MGFKDEVERIEEAGSGNIYVWRHGTGWPISKDDLDTFCSHMDDWYSCVGPFSREEYEKKCQIHGITAVPDVDIGGYGDTYGDFGMSHYHTVPKNRLNALKATLNQGRWWGIQAENPNVKEERRRAREIENERLRLEEVRKGYPVDLQAWITAVGGLETIYTKALKIHESNSTQLREEGRHFEWLIGHACLHLDTSINWWAGWMESDLEHPLNRISKMLSDKRIEPNQEQIVYMGYGEDCGDDVRRNYREFFA